jgi:hypothetical protein
MVAFEHGGWQLSKKVTEISERMRESSVEQKKDNGWVAKFGGDQHPD